MDDDRWPPRRLVAVVGPIALAVVQVVGTFGASRGQPERREIDLLAVVLVIVGPLSLLVVRRYPLSVLWFVSAVTLGYLAAGYPYGPVIFGLAVAVVVAVVLGQRRIAWATVAVVVAGHLAARAWIEGQPWSWPGFLGVVAWALLILVGAEFVRARRERLVTARRARAEAARREASEERLRIAHELHDVVAHHISLINVQAGVALHLVDRKPEQAQTALAAIKDASKEALTELRSLVGVLREESEPAARAPAAMLDSLDDLVERSGYAGLTVRQSVEGDVQPLPSTVELAAYRIIQEAITNVVRHAGAERADVTLTYTTEELVVRVDDDGRQGAVGNQVEGSGIQGMRERATALGGTITVSDSPAGGTRVRAELPLGGKE